MILFWLLAHSVVRRTHNTSHILSDTVIEIPSNSRSKATTVIVSVKTSTFDVPSFNTSIPFLKDNLAIIRPDDVHGYTNPIAVVGLAGAVFLAVLNLV